MSHLKNGIKIKLSVVIVHISIKLIIKENGLSIPKCFKLFIVFIFTINAFFDIFKRSTFFRNFNFNYGNILRRDEVRYYSF